MEFGPTLRIYIRIISAILGLRMIDIRLLFFSSVFKVKIEINLCKYLN